MKNLTKKTLLSALVAASVATPATALEMPTLSKPSNKTLAIGSGLTVVAALAAYLGYRWYTKDKFAIPVNKDARRNSF